VLQVPEGWTAPGIQDGKGFQLLEFSQ